jgi:hypothetical protein
VAPTPVTPPASIATYTAPTSSALYEEVRHCGSTRLSVLLRTLTASIFIGDPLA